jgi:hypothetical protein
MDIIKVELDKTLWWFNGEDPANYDVSGTLTAHGVSLGSFKWDVVNGDDKVNLNNGGTDADSITATDDPSVTIKSTKASATAADVTKDVTIALTYNGTVVCTYDLAVFAPHSLNHLWDEHNPIPAPLAGYQSIIHYEILDQFGDVLPKEVPWNEDIDGNGIYSDLTTLSTSQISDWTIANGKAENQNWAWNPENGILDANPADAQDQIKRNWNPGRVPQPHPPGTPLSTEKISHNLPGALYVGGATPGTGIKVKDVMWQLYLDHALHE